MGLILGALFFVIRGFMKILERKDERQSSLISEMSKESKDEREEMVKRFSRSSERLSVALEDLSKEIRETNRTRRSLTEQDFYEEANLHPRPRPATAELHEH